MASDELFNGSFYGWRFGPGDVDRNISVDCEGGEYGSDHPTDLDFHAEYLPEGHATLSVVKWACGQLGFSVAEEYSFEDVYPGSYVFLQRGRTGTKAVQLLAPVDFVRACKVAGRPAVCVHYMDDATGRGGHPAQIIVIEDGLLDPHAVLFQVMGSELPFDELMKMMETVVGD